MTQRFTKGYFKTICVWKHCKCKPTSFVSIRYSNDQKRWISLLKRGSTYMHRSLVGLNTALARQESDTNTSTKMSLDHRFVFADNLVLRCKCEKDEYFPIEILDFEDILGRLKSLLSSRTEPRRNSVSYIALLFLLTKRQRL